MTSAPAFQAPPPASEAEDGLPRVLLVDDEPNNHVALRAVLEGKDRVLVHAHSGEEALRQLLQADFALIVLDVHMPGMDGFETAELIRARERTRDVPILFVTAAVRGEFAIARGFALGAVDYLLRPLDADILRFKVDVFIDLYRKTAEVRRQALDLADARALLDSVVQGASAHAIVALDPAGKVELWNDGARRMYGYLPIEMLGRDLARLFPAGSSPSSLLALVDLEGRFEGALDQLRASGELFTARIALSQRRSTQVAGGYVLIAEDITEERAAEAREREIQQLREANTLKDEFLGLVSHELRTPLTTVLGNAQVLAGRWHELEPATVDESVLAIQQGSRRLQNMVESMLMLSHLEGGQEAELEPLLLQRLIPAMTADFTNVYGRRPMALDIPATLPLVLAHPTYLAQIVVNMLSNAMKYSPAGSAIEVLARDEGEVVRVSVLDRGSGITAEDAAVIFEPFRRLSRTQFQAPGAGLGLTVCSRLVAALGGEVAAAPREGGGSCFSFTVPCFAPEAPATAVE